MIFYKEAPYYDYIGEKLPEPVYHALPTVKSASSLVTSKNLDENGNRIYKKYEYATKTNLLAFPRDIDKLHPTQKPVDLLEYLIKTYTHRGDTVLDFTMGSGSCGVAAVNTHRDFIGIELDSNYYEIASKRIEQAQKDKAYSLFPEM